MKLSYSITGIDCPNCAAKLERQLQKIDGVTLVSLNFMTSKLLVEGEDGKQEEIERELARLVKKSEPDAVLKAL